MFVSQLGAIFQSVLPSNDGHPSIMLIAQPQWGKSLYMSAALSCTSDVAPGAKLFTASLPDATKFAVGLVAERIQNWCFFADDYRTSGLGPVALARVKDAITRLLQAAYGASSTISGTQDQELRVGKRVNVSGLLTGEELPSDDAIRSRVLGVELKRKVDLAPVAAWGKEHMASARKIVGAHIQHILAHVDEVGLEVFRDENHQRRVELAEVLDRKGRTSELAVHLLLGWEWFFGAFPEAAGILPSWTEIVDVVRSIVDENDAQQSASKVAARLIAYLTDQLSSGQAHLDNAAHEAPQFPALGLTPAHFGWAMRDHGARSDWEPLGRKSIGKLSTDGSLVCVPREALMEAARMTGNGGISNGGLDLIMRDLVVSGSQAGDRVPASMKFEKRWRGFVLTVEQLDIFPSVAA